MRAVTYNIQWGKGRDGKIDLDRIVRTIAGADIIALQEVERHWRQQDHPDQVTYLASRLPHHHWVYGAAVDLDGGQPGRRRQIGNMILSRFPISSTRTLPLPSCAVQGHMNDQQSAIEAVIETGEWNFRIYNTHLNYLSPGQRQEQINRLKAFIAEAPANGGPITMPGLVAPGPEDDWIVLEDGKLPGMPEPFLLLGDFNCTPLTEEYRSLAAFAGGEALALAGLKPTDGVTFPASAGEPAQRLDHIFLSASLRTAFQGAWIDNEAAGSDHQPVWIELNPTPAG